MYAIRVRQERHASRLRKTHALAYALRHNATQPVLNQTYTYIYQHIPKNWSQFLDSL